MPDYLLTVKVSFSALDDIHARILTKAVVGKAEAAVVGMQCEKEVETKLQEVKGNKPPRKVAL